MRKTALSALGLVAVLTAPATAAVGTPGPFAGAVGQGESRTHLYGTHPSNSPCIALAVQYTVALTYAPPTDTLTLYIGSTPTVGANGSARVTFWGSYCSQFPITVEGTSVTARAGYVVSVASQALVDQ